MDRFVIRCYADGEDRLISRKVSMIPSIHTVMEVLTNLVVLQSPNFQYASTPATQSHLRPISYQIDVISSIRAEYRGGSSTRRSLPYRRRYMRGTFSLGWVYLVVYYRIDSTCPLQLVGEPAR
jgi:hypothetical protein